MMNKKNKKAWVDALRSGEYKQGKGALHRNGKFCCLGVAADIFLDGWWEKVNGGRFEIEIEAGRHSCLSYVPPGVDVADVIDLYTMNDNGKSFDEIADYIEEHL